MRFPKTGNLELGAESVQVMPSLSGQRVLELTELLPMHLTCLPPHPSEEGKAGLDEEAGSERPRGLPQLHRS